MQGLTNLPRSAVHAYDALSLPVWLFCVETLRILASNQAARQWLGYDAQTLHAMTIADLRPEADRPRIADQVRQFEGIETEAGTWTIIARSGDRYTVSFHWKKVMFDGSPAIVASIRDMTQVAQARAQAHTLASDLQAMEQRGRLKSEHFSRLFDAVPGKMLVLTPTDYVIVAVTDEYSQAVSAERDALMGRRLFEAFPDDPNEPDADGVRNLMASLQRVEALLITDVMNIQRYPVRAPDGSFQERFWLPLNKPVFDSSGQLLYIIHRAEDVTQSLMEHGLAGASDPPSPSGDSRRPFMPLAAARETLLALQERETRLRTAESLLEIGPWEHDPQQGTLSWSRRVFQIYGIPPDQGSVSFDDYVSMVHPDDRPKMMADYTRFIDTGAPTLVFEHRIRRGDGKIAHIRGVGARHRVSGREIVIGYVQDITHMKESEERLIDAARLQKRAGYMARLGGWRVDLDEPRITWSPETAAIHDEPEGTSPSLDSGINYYLPEYRDHIRARVQACAVKGDPFDETLQIVTAKGRHIWVRAIGEPVRNKDGRIVAIEGAFQDISELVAARDVSEDLSRRLRQTLERISDAFLLLDHDWRFSFLNNQAQVLLQRRRDDLLGKNIWAEFPEAVGSTFQTEYERAMNQGQTTHFRSFYPALNAWFEVAAYPTREGLAVYFRDITQERARDEQLHLLESAVSRQNDVVLITSAGSIDEPQGPKIVYVNDAFVRLTGYSRDEAVGQTPRLLQGPRTRRDELDRIRHALTHWQPARAELINYTKAGREFWLEIDIVPLADATGVFTHWVAIGRDITARKLDQQALQMNEERFRFVAKATGNAVWEWDIALNKQWWSEGLREIFGHTPDSDEALQTIWVRNIHPDDKERIERAIGRLLAQEDDSFKELYRFRRADGSWARVEDRAFAVRDGEGHLVRVLGSITDISERLQLEDRLQQAQKMEAVGQLTGGVAHDFNNLLTVIVGNGEILSEELVDKPDLKALAEMISSAGIRGAELTNRLLAFSRRQALQPRVMDVSSLVHGMEDLLRRTLPENIDIEIIRSGGLWKAEIDPGQLESTLLNMALNARDAMPDGGCLTIEMANASIDDNYAAGEPGIQTGDYVVIIITDTGHGIPADTLNRIFEPFFTTKEVGKGSGLGLSMVYGFVKQSGGHIRVYSEPGEGTSFKLYFPRSDASTDPARPGSDRTMVVGGGETILVVEDDNLVRAHAMRPTLKILFTSGYTQNSIVHNGKLDPGIDLLNKPYRREQLAVKIRQVLDNT